LIPVVGEPWTGLYTDVGGAMFEPSGRIRSHRATLERLLAFQGRRIGRSYEFEADAYLTPKGAIAVYDATGYTLYVYDTFAQLASDKGVPQDLVAEVAGALGERYVEELDI
jgi:hypothetical protein